MELAIRELEMRHPNLDRLMIETLFKLHEEGTLNSFSEQLQAPPPSPLNPEKCLLQGAITIEEENLCK